LITFNDVLRSAGVDPVDVHLARHQDARTRGRSIYAIWKSPDGPKLVQEYQAVQTHDRFTVGGFVASFVVTPPARNETLFIGLYKVPACDRRTAACPVTHEAGSCRARRSCAARRVTHLAHAKGQGRVPAPRSGARPRRHSRTGVMDPDQMTGVSGLSHHGAVPARHGYPLRASTARWPPGT
jgi:hypothetical protein